MCTYECEIWSVRNMITIKIQFLKGYIKRWAVKNCSERSRSQKKDCADLHSFARVQNWEVLDIVPSTLVVQILTMWSRRGNSWDRNMTGQYCFAWWSWTWSECKEEQWCVNWTFVTQIVCKDKLVLRQRHLWSNLHHQSLFSSCPFRWSTNVTSHGLQGGNLHSKAYIHCNLCNHFCLSKLMVLWFSYA